MKLCMLSPFSHVQLFATLRTIACMNTGVGCHALLQGILPTQGSNPSSPKTEFLCQVNGKFLYPKCYSLSGPARVPLKIEEYQRKGVETEQDLQDTPGHKGTSVSPVCDLEEKVFNLLDLP